MSAPRMVVTHLARMSDGIGLFEHADHTQPRRDHGFCVDDVARGLVVTTREPSPDTVVTDLARLYLDFLLRSQGTDGRIVSRCSAEGVWQGRSGLDDPWGRALWGFGTAAARSAELSDQALTAFDSSARHRSPHSRSMAFAAMGAAEVLSVHPEHDTARRLLRTAALQQSRTRTSRDWPWPEPRLRYANAVLPEVLLAAGSLLDEPQWTAQGLAMLTWLVATETNGEHLSVTPVGGWSSGEPRPAYDQQPIEVAALADAAARALALTGDPLWSDTLARCAAWFTGANDTGIAMIDPVDGSGFDGLEASGRNENRGAESTLAALSTMQQAVRCLTLSP